MKKILITFIIVVFCFTGLFSQNDTVVLDRNAAPAPATTKPEETDKPKEKKPPKKNKTPFMKRIYFGGGIGATFGSNYSSFRINPLIGYKIIPKLSFGLQFQYEHIKNKYYSSTYTADNYGGSLFARFRVIKPIYVHAEYSMISYENYYQDQGSTDVYSVREMVPFLFLGAGFSKRLAGNSWLNFQVLFDVIQNDKSPYRKGEPFYSVGVGLGF